jgi:hypothetical protein
LPNQTSPERGKTVEELRLDEARERGVPWKQWGPYLSERQWGTVREDYSENGDAWNYFTHDQARSRAYHWGEDGLAGFSDDHQRLCFAVALWNGKDPILKERLFGLTNSEGNHGEDVKEYYFYLDSTPTHSYMKYLYKYPQNAYPYADLIETNRRRGRNDWEYELLDTGIFNDDRYFDVFVEYAKATPTDILIQINLHNRGPQAASLHVLPTLWFRNTWTWWPDQPKPSLRQVPGQNTVTIETSHTELGSFMLHCDGNPQLLFTENDTNNERLFGTPNATPYVKDGINDHVVSGREDAVNPNQTGTKAAAHYQLNVGAGQTAIICRQCDAAGASRDAVEQAVLLLRHRPMARGTWLRRDAADAASGAQPRVVPHDRRRRHFDAGQVGVSLVCRLGSGVSHASPGDRRHRFRQRAARSAAAPTLPASDRTNSSL